LTTNLSPKVESFIQTMRQGEEFARHGFDLLAARSAPEQYFDPLRSAGFFDPRESSGPVPSTEQGFVHVPFWPALRYLEAVAKRANELDDAVLANKLLSVVRDVTYYRDPNGESRDNYHTYYKFADILGLLPLRAITEEDVQLVRVWLNSKFDNSLVGSSLGKGLLKRLISSGQAEDIKKACILMKECMAFRWLPADDNRGRDLVTAIDDYWLKELVDTQARALGAKAGLSAVQIFEEGVRAIFTDQRRRYGSGLWRPAIEDNQQNMDFKAAENRFVEGMRDSLAGWIEAAPIAASDFVNAALHDELEIVRRIAIHTCTENFDLLMGAFEAAISPAFFSTGHRHELYRLLQERFAGLSVGSKEAVISALRSLPEPETGEEAVRRLKYIQREWLSAIKNQPAASAWYAELSSDPSLGPPADHPDFLSYHETRHGPGPSPFGTETLVAFAEDGTLIERLHDFEETDSWKGPTLGGLTDALEHAVAKAPNTFLPLLSSFHSAKLPFQHALLTGFKRLFDTTSDAKPDLDWAAAWPKLIKYFAECIADPAFWAHSPEENARFTPTRGWMVTLIAGFLEAGTKDDKTAYPPELLAQGWEIITTLLGRAPEEKASLTDPMTHALNTEKGRLISAMYNHALRVCRLAKKNKHPVAEAWMTLQSAFDAEIGQCCNANFEFSTLSASYIGNIEFMSHDWLVANVQRLFPSKEYPINFRAALGGLAYARPTRALYQLLAASDVFANALSTNAEDKHSRERIVEWIALAYLWGDETLEAPIFGAIFAAGVDDLQTAAGFYRRVYGDKLTPEQVRKVIAFWKKCIEWSKTQEKPPSALLSQLSRLSTYLKTLDDAAKTLLLEVVPYVHTDYSSGQMVEELSRFVGQNPAGVAEVLERMLEANAPNYDLDNRLKGLIESLAGAGLRAEAIRCTEKLRKSLPGMLDLYKKLVPAT
jgi:hypothetical protein